MDVIGNNIANVNTAGYKTARVIFQDIFSQNLSAGMANQGEIGGTNPMQVGLGIRLSTVDIIHTRAAFQRTDKETDMMINGDGFFIVGQQNPETGQYETFYTRAGNFDLDNEGFLVTSQGFYVMGRTYALTMGVVSPGNERVEGRPMVRQGQFRPADPGTELDAVPPTTVAGLLANYMDAAIPANEAEWNAAFPSGVTIPAGNYFNPGTGDPRGRIPAAGGYNIPNWATFDAQRGAAIAGHPAVTINDSPAIPIPENFFRMGDVIPIGLFGAGDPDAQITLTTATLLNQWNARLPLAEPAFPWPMTAMAAVATVPARAPIFGLVASDDFIGIEAPDENGLTRIRATVNATKLPEDPITRLPVGYPLRNVGETDEAYTLRLETWLENLPDTEDIGLPGLGVADNGDISVIVGNRKLVIARLAIAMFANPAGLEAAGNSLYRQTDSSGNVIVTEAFADGAGKLEGGGLEMSNVDLANEFTDMIVTQRGFQANSRIVTVTDAMLEELVNLKR